MPGSFRPKLKRTCECLFNNPEEEVIWRVPEDKIIYSRELEDPGEYTNKLNNEYTKYARAYDIAVKILPFWKTWLKKVIPHIEGKRVLEVSFGTGYLLCLYAGEFEAYGIDYNDRMVKIARKNLRKKGIHADLQQADAESLPFRDEFFDCIVNTMSFTGYPNGRQVMSEFYRVLKCGGKLIILDFDYPADRNRFGYTLVKLMEAAGDTIKDICGFLKEFSFNFNETEVGGFGSVHLYTAIKS
jgi:ubiquinone/menaquinone biosynthesis C-methylase UbiE